MRSAGATGIDHRWNEDDSGIWSHRVQKTVLGASLAGLAGAAVWEGGESRLGKTLWRSIDSTLLAGAIANGAKPLFGRMRPGETDNPNQWFKGGHHSFPSGDVATLSGLVAPFVLEYRRDHPAVYALELLPAYDAIARIKVRAHWQTDVLASFALGLATGNNAHQRDNPVVLGVLPHGFSVGIRRSW